MAGLQDTLLNDFSSEAERSFALGDTFDMKANVLLVVITFLAAQTAYFLSVAKLPVERYAQMASAFLIMVSGALVLWELVPRNYIFFSPTNGAIEKTIARLQQEHRNSGVDVAAGLIDKEIEWARERANEHKKHNKVKSRLLWWSFLLVALSVGINLLTLACFAIHPFLEVR